MIEPNSILLLFLYSHILILQINQASVRLLLYLVNLSGFKSCSKNINLTIEWINLFEIIELHDQYKSLLSVSDESVIFHNMSFGWVLATPNGDFLTYGAGPCTGRGSSLRAKGAGMLTVVVFMSLIIEYTGKDGAKLQCISDNQELINRMTEHK